MTSPQAKSMIERLTAHQDRALDVVARSEALLARNDRNLTADLAQLRWEMMRVMMPYGAFKHGELFPAMMAAVPADKLGMVTSLREDCLALGADFKAYVTRWSSVCVADCWDQFLPDARAMAARVKTHMRRERTAAETILIAAHNRPALLAMAN